ncbi:MAG: porin [Rhodospirillaceae bacterium]|nr:porin [Rhodospirillaceae bacterium]
MKPLSALLPLCAALLWAETAQAADAITLTLGGRIKEFFAVADQDQKPGEDLNTVAMFNDVRISAEGKTALDNGISIRSYVRAFAVGREAVDVDEAYVDVVTTFGRLRMGEKAGVNASTIGDPIPEAFLTVDDELIGDGLRPRTGIVLRDAFTFKRFTGNALGVSYQTPDFLGIKAGVAYHPTPTPAIGTFDRRLGPHDALDVTAGYDGDFAGGTYRVAGGYFHLASRTGGTLAGSGDGVEAWNMSAGATYGGWEIGTGYMRVIPENGTTESDWIVGILYGIGPFQISADYKVASRRVSRVSTARERVDRGTLQAAYKLGPGISVGLGGFYVTQRDSTGTAWDSGGVLSGLKIGF